MKLAAGALLSLFAGCVPVGALAQQAAAQPAPQPSSGGAFRAFTVVGDAVPESLTGTPGDPERGRALVVNRQVGLCLLCHTGPFPEEPFQGNLAPDLTGTGARWSAGQLRLRMVDAARLNPATIMPAYHRIDGQTRVAAAWQGKPIFSARQIEDVVAFLGTLK